MLEHKLIKMIKKEISLKSKKYKHVLKISPDDYIHDTFDLAEDFYDAARIILKSKKNKNLSVFIIAGYLATHSAELYMKAYLISLQATKSLYYKIRDLRPSHDLIKIFNMVKEMDKKTTFLENKIKILNKYSGDKIRFVEASYQPNSPSEYDTNEIWPINEIRNYFRPKLVDIS